MTSSPENAGMVELAGCTLVAGKADVECGCPEEEWETPWGYLHMHLNSGKPSDAYLDTGDAEFEDQVTASGPDTARAAIFVWAERVTSASLTPNTSTGEEG